MADHPLDGVAAKLLRAREHFDALKDGIGEWAEANPCSVVAEVEAQGHEIVYRVEDIASPPLRLGAILGDFFHNLHSALDHLACQLSIAHSGEVLPGTSFPIFANRARYVRTGRDGRPSFRSGLNAVRGMSPSAQAVIEELQPYDGRDGAPQAALWAVRGFSNTDKHAVIHSQFMAVTKDLPERAAPVWANEDAGESGMLTVTGFGKALEDGAEVARLHMPNPSGPNPQVAMPAELAFEVAFGEIGLRLKAIPSIHREIVLICRRFDAEFP